MHNFIFPKLIENMEFNIAIKFVFKSTKFTAEFEKKVLRKIKINTI